jgi:hypothetical protein
MDRFHERLLALLIIIPMLGVWPFVLYTSIPIVRDQDAGFEHSELTVN